MRLVVTLSSFNIIIINIADGDAFLGSLQNVSILLGEGEGGSLT